MTSFNAATCPGIRNFLRPKPEYFQCPNCAGSVEIWSDEDKGICDTCDKEVNRPEKEPSCLDWCQYEDKCREIIKRKKH